MKSRTLLISALLFGSGACALTYQTVWLREFRMIFGGSTAASAAVLAIFMGSLGAGGLVLGRRVDHKARPLRFYACLEPTLDDVPIAETSYEVALYVAA
jgi:spermidine synthase